MEAAKIVSGRESFFSMAVWEMGLETAIAIPAATTTQIATLALRRKREYFDFFEFGSISFSFVVRSTDISRVFTFYLRGAANAIFVKVAVARCGESLGGIMRIELTGGPLGSTAFE
jgi:hypothetical protein